MYPGVGESRLRGNFKEVNSKMKKIAKILSVVLCMVMVLGLMATTTFAAGGTATITFVTDTTANWSSATVKDGSTVVATLTGTKESGQYAPANNKDDDVRIYTDNKLTITPAAGVTITSVSFKCTSSNYGMNSDVKLTNAAWTTTGKDSVLTPANGTAPIVLLNNKAKVSGVSEYQIRIKSITISYITGSADDCQHTEDLWGAWQKNDTHHWKTCSCGDTTKRAEATHTYVKGECVCGAKIATVGTIKEVLDDATDGRLWTITGTVTSVNKDNIYVQDATGGILIYKDTFATDPVVGDVITTTGEYDFYGVAELVNCASYTSSGNSPITAETVTFADLANKLCQLVTITGEFTVIEVYDNSGKYTTPNITAEDENGNKFTLYMAPLTKVDGEWPIAVGDVITSATGAVGMNKDVYRIVSRSADEIVFTTDGGDVTPPAGDDDDDKDDDVVVTPPAGGTGSVEGIAPVNGATIKLGLWQNGMGKFLYFNGEVAKTYYLGTTEDYAVAVNLTVEQVEGGWLLWFTKDGVKTYVDMVPSGTHINAKMVTDKPTPLTWNATYKTFTKNIEGVDYFFGTYTKSDGTNYTTISCSKLSMLEGDDNYPCHLYAEEPAKTGDISSVFVALLAVSAIGAGALISKKGKFVA